MTHTKRRMPPHTMTQTPLMPPHLRPGLHTAPLASSCCPHGQAMGPVMHTMTQTPHMPWLAFSCHLRPPQAVGPILAPVRHGGAHLHQGAHHHRLCGAPRPCGAVLPGPVADAVQRHGERTHAGGRSGHGDLLWAGVRGQAVRGSRSSVFLGLRALESRGLGFRVAGGRRTMETFCKQAHGAKH